MRENKVKVFSVTEDIDITNKNDELQRSEISPRSSGGRKLHRYSGLIKCAECGSHFVAKNRTWRGKEYVEYTCNSNHRYGKQYCTPHRIHESQLDELVFGEV